ncbi:hypothetical protein KZ483_05510 [Paenibacillus sp. sptzw28]|uniref:hypothetical protein n=1 Tax=Paenibacillus sp. sptzw28 TaxID=715179 RepID=UPI001C6DF2ED|nr:hypothetical protein [Paenibacillus sp. sptzw28]QYR22436.1 hypothetical protein KZ483_05510 [Paenibacillus sp. sptzw28]
MNNGRFAYCVKDHQGNDQDLLSQHGFERSHHIIEGFTEWYLQEEQVHNEYKSNAKEK